MGDAVSWDDPGPIHALCEHRFRQTRFGQASYGYFDLRFAAVGAPVQALFRRLDSQDVVDAAAATRRRSERERNRVHVGHIVHDYGYHATARPGDRERAGKVWADPTPARDPAKNLFARRRAAVNEALSHAKSG